MIKVEFKKKKKGELVVPLKTFNDLIEYYQNKIDKAAKLIHKAMVDSDIKGNGELDLNNVLKALEESD